MSPERWREVKAVFQGALSVEPAARPRHLDEACGADEELRREVESLLASLDGAGDFLERDPAAEESTASYLPRVCGSCGARYGATTIVCPADGEVLAEDAAALVGETLDGLYRIESLLGRGGFGDVYAARHELLDDRVAVKVLRRDLAANPSYVRRFLQEGRAARAISHPSVVSIHDLRASGDLVYLVMELVDGRTLREELAERGPLGPAEALEVVERIADALDAAHALGVVHRDLKPENVMLAEADGARAVKVLDLGIAKLGAAPGEGPDSATLLTMPGERMGSPRYMPPEQWGVDPGDGGPAVDARADVYGLAAVAYELLTGRVPFEGESLWELRRAHAEAAPALDGVPGAVARVLARGLAKRRSDRPATAGALASELRDAWEAPEAPPRRRAGARAAAVAAALALAAWGGVSLVAERGSPPDAPPAPAAAARAPSYAAMSERERFEFVDEQARRVAAVLTGSDASLPPDARASIKREVDRYAARAGTGEARGPREDLRFELERGRRFAPEIGRGFAGSGVPPLVGLYIAMVESGYRPDVVSPSGARGVFQILPSTAAELGAGEADLADAERSARLAARYVAARADELSGDPMRLALAIAAYNLGPRDVARFMEEVVALDDEEAERRFWAFVGNTGFDSVENRETPRYIATFFAAAIVGENPAAFGVPLEPLTSYASQ